MNTLLFVHNNFPGQFGFIAEAMVARGHRCAAIASSTGRELPGVTVRRWKAKRSSSKSILPDAIRAEADLIRAIAAAEAALELKQQGFYPDVIIGHPGWGETLYLREIFPRARQIVYAEYFYRTADGDVGFDPEFGAKSAPMSLHAKNMGMALALSDADQIVAPTPFQASRLPAAFRHRTTILHEGVDLTKVRRNAEATWTTADGRVLDGKRPVVTFVARRLEPLRGFHIFMRSLPGLLQTVPDVDVVVVGDENGAGYGAAAPDGSTWASVVRDELGDRIDPARVHFTGRLPYERLLDVYSLSWAHVYFTYPFVLSWSLLEAMACGALILGSNTAPVRDVITHEKNGVLFDFFDTAGLSTALAETCRRPEKYHTLRQNALRTIKEGFDRSPHTARWAALIESLCSAV